MRQVKVISIIILVLVVGVVAIQLFYKGGSKKMPSNDTVGALPPLGDDAETSSELK